MVKEVKDIVTVTTNRQVKKTNSNVIVTCLTGDYEKPTDGFKKENGFDYILFCDKEIETKSWECVVVEFKDGNNLSHTKKQRFVKTHLCELLGEYDLVIYVDANTIIDKKLYDYINKHKNNVVTFKKHARNCVYKEIEACRKIGKENNEVLDIVKKRLEEEKYPKNNGLFENNIIVLKPNDENVNRLMRLWWNEIYYYSKRDQLSLNYVIWKNKLNKLISSAITRDFPPKKHTEEETIKPLNVPIKNKKNVINPLSSW